MPQDPVGAWIDSLPLAFGHGTSKVVSDLDLFFDALSLSAHLCEFDALGVKAQFVHRASTAIVGDLAITACAHTPIVGTTVETSESLVTLGCHGEITYTLEGRHWQSRSDQGVYLPGAAVTGQGWGSGLLFNIDPARLSRELSFRSRERWSVERARRFLQSPQTINMADPAVAMALRAIKQALRCLELPGEASVALRLALEGWVEDQLYICVAQMLRPQPSVWA